MLKPLSVWITTNCRKFWNKWEYQNTLPASWETRGGQEATVKNWHETMDCFKIGKRVHQGYILSSCLFNLYAEYLMQNAGLDESQWNQDCWEKYQQPQICRWYHSNGRKWRETKEPLEEGERGELKAGLKVNIQKNKIKASGPITSWQIDWETIETVAGFIFLGSKITVDGDCSHKIKRHSLEEKLWQT